MGLRDLVMKALAPKAGQLNVKTSAAGPVIAFNNVGRPKWTPRRYDTLADEGFRKNVIAYRCAMVVSTAAAAIPWLLYDGAGAEIDRHPLLDILRHPNPLQDGMAFLESLFANLQIAGNAYVEAVQPRDGHLPVELYALRPDRMKVVPGPTGLPQAYEYNVNGQLTRWSADPITGGSAILHIKLFHPLEDWYGLAPMEAALMSVDQHNAAGAWNQALLNQGARPSGALVFSPKDGSPANLSDDQLQRLREEMTQLYQGKTNAGRPLILEGGLDWREMSLSPKDMDWLAGRDVAARDIALAFGVPAQLIGIPGAQTHANLSEARLALYEETVLPLVSRVIAAFDHWLTPMFDDNLTLDFDMDEISAMTVRRDTQWDKLQRVDFLTVNEKRAALGYEPVDGGDKLGGQAPRASLPFDNPSAGVMDAPQGTTGVTPIPLPTIAPGKYNHNHDDLGRFSFGDGGEDDGSGDSSGGNDVPAEPGLVSVYPIETLILALLPGGSQLLSLWRAFSAISRVAENDNPWTLGDFKSATRWANQIFNRNWTPEDITNTITNGEQFPAPNKVNPENTATRYQNPDTGRFVVRDDVTKEILQISGDDFEPNLPTKQ